MATPNIVMTRIDERLVHGQGQLWVKSLGVNTVIVANDQASQDAMAQTLMKTLYAQLKVAFQSNKSTLETFTTVKVKKK